MGWRVEIEEVPCTKQQQQREYKSVNPHLRNFWLKKQMATTVFTDHNTDRKPWVHDRQLDYLIRPNIEIEKAFEKKVNSHDEEFVFISDLWWLDQMSSITNLFKSGSETL